MPSAGTPGTAGADGIVVDGDDVAPVAATPGVDGIAARLLAVATSASDSTTGSLVKLAEARDSAVKDFQARIDAWDTRLTTRQASLEKYYTNLETALGKLQSQSNWLAGQLNNLPTWSR